MNKLQDQTDALSTEDELTIAALVEARIKTVKELLRDHDATATAEIMRVRLKPKEGEVL